MLKKPEAILIEEIDGKSSPGFAFPRLTEHRRIPLHVKLIVDVAVSPHCTPKRSPERKRYVSATDPVTAPPDPHIPGAFRCSSAHKDNSESPCAPIPSPTGGRHSPACPPAPAPGTVP